MKIRTRLTLWFVGILFVSLLAMGILSYYELVAEPNNRAGQPAKPGEDEADQSDLGDVIAILAWCGLPALALSLGGGWWLMRTQASTPRSWGSGRCRRRGWR
jgi:hypothetical protein